jgi:hypothetical protein
VPLHASAPQGAVNLLNSSERKKNLAALRLHSHLQAVALSPGDANQRNHPEEVSGACTTESESLSGSCCHVYGLRGPAISAGSSYRQRSEQHNDICGRARSSRGDDENCVKILKNCYKALPADGKVITVDHVLPEIIDLKRVIM